MVSIASVHTPYMDLPSQKPSILKRKHSDIAQSPDPPQTKRPRVAFSDNVELHTMPDYKEKGMDLVREEVKRAISKRAERDDVAYNQIQELFTKKPTDEDAPSSTLLRKYLLALTSESARLDQNYGGLVNAVLKCHWALRDDAFVRAFRCFLQTVGTAHMGYCETIYKEIASMFRYPPRPGARHPDDPLVTRDEIWSRAHECLADVFGRVPFSAATLKTILDEEFPHHEDPARPLANYIKNLFEIGRQHTSLNGSIQSLVMQQLVKIDSAIQEDLDELEEGVGEDLVNELQEESEEEDDDDDDDESDAESVTSDGSMSPASARLKAWKEKARKLDHLLDIVFEHYHDIFVHGGKQADDSFIFLLKQFSKDILYTERTRHVQFLLFHYAQTSPRYAEEFITRCAFITIDKEHERHLMERMTAAYYLASFVARGAHVARPVVRDLFVLLCDNLESYRRTTEHKCAGPDARLYGPYYAQFQALLYIFCFRWRDLIVRPTDNTFSTSLAPTDDWADEETALAEGIEFTWYADIQTKFTAALHSRFNPLKVCSPDVVAQFARIAHYVRFMYVHSKIAANTRVRLGQGPRPAVGVGRVGTLAVERETALTSRASGDRSFQLEAYFPFDPYKLPRSKRWLEGDYVEWKRIPGLDGPEDDEDDEEDSEDDEDDEDEEDDDDDASEVDEDQAMPDPECEVPTAPAARRRSGGW